MYYTKSLFTFYLSILTVLLSYAQKKNITNNDVVCFDNFEHTSQASTPVNWFTYNDNTLSGKSTGTNQIIKDSASQNQYIQFTYTLDQAKCKWAPYAALSSTIASDVLPNGMQAISYRFKGNAHMLVVKTSNIKDYCYYNIDIPASAVWTMVTIPISELRQPSWGTQVNLDIHTFEGLSWQITGKTQDTGTVSVDDVNLLYSPQLVLNPKPIAPKPLKYKAHTIHSKFLNEDRQVYIYLPPSYNASKDNLRTYPVMYVLDGDYFIEDAGRLIEKLIPVNYNTAFPEMIVVGIANTSAANRTRDLSPTHISSDPFDGSNRFDASGGGPAFMSFIEKELMPMIEKTYPTINYKTFVGHSLGGLTVLHTLINKPYLFDAYLALDPSTWWDDQLLLKQINAASGKINLRNKKLYIAIANDLYKGIDTADVRNGQSSFFFPLTSNLNIVDALKKHSNNGLAWSYAYYPDENHHTVTSPGLLDGLKYLFELKQSEINKHFTIKDIPFGAGFIISNTLAPVDMGYTIFPPEKMIHDYGYSCLAKKEYTRALSLFQFNAANYPSSPFVFDALGDYYVVMKDVENARKNYTQALVLSEGRLPETKRKSEQLGPIKCITK
jgi:predicted alpha/beta superfamily hydrolase